MYKLILAVSFILLFDLVSAQITTNGSALTDLSSSPGTCAASGFQTVNFASTSGSCINFTTNGLTLESGAVWTCDPIDLNQTLKYRLLPILEAMLQLEMVLHSYFK